MRLHQVTHGHSLPQKLLLLFIRLVGGEAPDVVRALLYRRGFWGSHQNELLQDVMRGPSDWSVGERELFAAFTSRMNQCLF